MLAKFNAWSTHQTDENPTFFERHVSTLPQHSVIEGHLRDFIVESPRCGRQGILSFPCETILRDTVIYQDRLWTNKWKMSLETERCYP